jgi:hypothetical protein
MRIARQGQLNIGWMPMIGRALLSTHSLSGGMPIERQVYYFEGLQSIVANCQGARAPLNGFFPR